MRVLRSNASKIGGIYLGKNTECGEKHRCLLRGDCARGTVLSATTGSRYGISTNRQPDGSLKAGDELVVMVTRDAQKTKKRASATADPARMTQLLCKNGSTP